MEPMLNENFISPSMLQVFAFRLLQLVILNGEHEKEMSLPTRVKDRSAASIYRTENLPDQILLSLSTT